MKLYVVTSGSYSDYPINCIFSNKEKADTYASNIYDGRVEEWNLDEFAEYEPMMRYTSRISNDGTIQRCAPDKCMGMKNQRADNVIVYTSPDNRPSTYILHTSSYISQEHADKLAIEKRQEILREKALKC